MELLPMIYEVVNRSDRQVAFVTHARARRGRGVLFATAPLIIHLFACSALFVWSTQDLSVWGRTKTFAVRGGAVAAVLALGAFYLGRRMTDRVEADTQGLRLTRTPALGAPRVKQLSYPELTAFAVDPSIRSLGADVLLIAVLRDGTRLPLAEGEPHSGQIRELGQALATLSGVPLEAPKL
jgi:hypothetical protein